MLDFPRIFQLTFSYFLGIFSQFFWSLSPRLFLEIPRKSFSLKLFKKIATSKAKDFPKINNKSSNKSRLNIWEKFSTWFTKEKDKASTWKYYPRYFFCSISLRIQIHGISFLLDLFKNVSVKSSSFVLCSVVWKGILFSIFM